MLLRAALRALIWIVAALILACLALSALTSPGIAAAAAPLVCDGGAALVPAPAAEAADDGVEPPAYLCRGAGPDRPVTMTELIVAAAKAVGSALLVVLWPLLTWVFYRRAARGRKFVLADGVPATARVVAARPTVFADRSQRVMEIELDFAPDGAPARRIKHRQALPDAFHAALQPGLPIPALLDPADPERFVLLVEHIPLADPRDPAIPGAADPLRALDLLQGTWLMTADDAAARRARLSTQG